MAKRPNPWRRRVRVKGSKVVVDDFPNLSETLLEFARPLIDSIPDDPPSIEQVRQAMQFASIVWNVHVVADGDPEFGADVCAVLDDVPPELGPGARAALESMLETRHSIYAHDHRFASVEVVEAEGGWNILTRGAIMDDR